MSFQSSPLSVPVCKCNERRLISLGGDQNLLVKVLVSVAAIAVVILISCTLILYFGTVNFNATVSVQLQYLEEAVIQLKKDVEKLAEQQGQNPYSRGNMKLRLTRGVVKNGKVGKKKKKKKKRSHCKCTKEIKSLQRSIDMKTKRSATSQMNRRVAHLRGLESDMPSQSLYQGVRFLWQRPEPIYENSFQYEFEGDKVHTIGVFTDGIYEIYSQITLHGGEESGIVDRECGQKLVKQSLNGDITVLAKSFITQTDTRDTPLYASTQPLDTSFQKGYFFLNANDRVYISKNCERHINFLTSSNSSYFGILLVADFYSGR